MFHTAPLSEAAAWLLGLAFGLCGAGMAHFVGASPDACVGVGSGTALLASLVVGTPINIAMLDILSLIVLRPLSGAGIFYAVGAISRGMVS